jgi:hypothetical protein
MITVEECDAHLAECRKLLDAPDISHQRVTALMAVARAWLALSQQVARYHIIVKEECH